METLDTLRIVWYFILGFLFAGYSILDGFDLGIGITLPLLAKKEREKRALLSSIGPFWDGNEVWIITGGAALFAAFPHAYATVFSGFYLALMLVLFALIFRAVSIEFWSHDERRRKLWGWAFCIGSLLPALLFGVALGNVILGVPLNERMDFTGSFFTLLRPYPLAIGILGLTAILLQGASYSLVKMDGAISARSKQLIAVLWVIFPLVFAVALICTAIYMPEWLKKPLAWTAAVVVIIGWLGSIVAAKNEKSSAGLIMSSLILLGLWGIAGAVHFPNLVRASNNPELSLTIYNASSSQLTLTIMAVIALLGMPIVIAYTYFVYGVFKGKVSGDEGLYD
jgi:cytochrome d ubiquinol oxidase subunit II